MEMDKKTLGARIKEERRKKNLTQEGLGDMMGCSNTYIGQVERGERGLTVDRLVEICNCLGVTCDFLLASFLDDEDEYLRQQWIRLMKGRSVKEQEKIIKMVRAMLDELD
jgi:transcriptional regulator with XRE-family HTH domain